MIRDVYPQVVRYALVLLLLFVTVLPGCSLVPRIRILHDPLTAEEHLQLGLSYEAQGKLGVAIREYHAALKKGGKMLGASPLFFLGNAYAQQGELEKAERHYRRALAMEPENSEILNNLAWIYLEQGERLEEAEQLTRNALTQADSVHPSASRRRAIFLHTLAEIQMAQGRYEEALDTLQQAEDLIHPEQSAMRVHLYEAKTRAYEAIGETERAEQTRQRIKKLR